MSENNEVKRGRGRPVKILVLPDMPLMTVNDIWAKNPHFECRLSIYNKIGKLVKNKVLAYTGQTMPSDGPNGLGKPLDLLQPYEDFKLLQEEVKRSQAARKAARTRNKNRKVAALAALKNADAVDVTTPVAV